MRQLSVYQEKIAELFLNVNDVYWDVIFGSISTQKFHRPSNAAANRMYEPCLTNRLGEWIRRRTSSRMSTRVDEQASASTVMIAAIQTIQKSDLLPL